MSSLNKQSRTVEKGELTLVLNAAEGRLQLVLGRLAGRGSRRDAQAPGSIRLSAAPCSTGVHENAGSAGNADNTSGGELEILAAQDWMAVSQGAELLTPALRQILTNLHLEPEHIGRIAVVNGPGSFTGLRLVCVSAAALARGISARQAPLEYLPLLAGGVQEAGLPDFMPEEQRAELAIWVITYARRGLVYLQGFSLAGAARPKQAEHTQQEKALAVNPEDAAPVRPEGRVSIYGLPEKLSDLHVLELDAVLDFLRDQHAAHPGLHLLLGSGLSKNRELFAASLSASCPRLRLLPESFDLPSAAMLLRQAHGLEYSGADVTPLYVRPSDAEENLPQIAAKLGLDPDYALRRLEDLLRE